MKKRLFVLFLFIVSLISIKNVYAETYDGEYSVEYLLKNYSVVTLGIKDNNIPGSDDDFFKKGNIGDITNIEGAILINGNYSSEENATFGSKAGNIKSFIKGTKGENIQTNSTVLTNSDYIDFNKMYEKVLLTSENLIDNTQYHLQGTNLEVTKPGIYTVDNVATTYMIGDVTQGNEILIKNYDNNSLYVFNYYNEYIFDYPEITIMESGTPNSVSLKQYIESGNYKGNIILNFPKAKRIEIGGINSISGNMIAPNAIVLIYNNYLDYQYTDYNGQYINYYYGTIIANTICGINHYSSETYIRNIIKTEYALNEDILNKPEYYIIKAKDYNDDYYTRDYSIKDLLKNYSLITIGHKQINEKSKVLNLGNNPGSIKLFHITGQALISGDVLSKVYINEVDEYDQEFKKYDRTIFELESNEVTESYIKGNTTIDVPHKNNINYKTQKNTIITQLWDSMTSDNRIYIGNKNRILYDYNNDNYKYINFDRLYNNIVAEQKGIAEGKTLTAGSDGILHIPTGGTYTIDDINNVKEIVFDNFEKNKDELTIITIKNEGDINFPLISKDGNGYKGIVTNDYFGKEKATHLYELDTFLSEDSYYGNIVWNLPNADYIKLKENAPFAGHMIAPNADVETPELHFAGCFIVNSIYGEGNTEAHFYPINTTLKCEGNVYDGLSETQKKKFNEYRLSKELGGDNTIIEKEIIGDKDQYNKDVALFEDLDKKCENRTIEINPETFSTIGIILGLLVLGSIGYITLKSRKKGITKE